MTHWEITTGAIKDQEEEKVPQRQKSDGFKIKKETGRRGEGQGGGTASHS